MEMRHLVVVLISFFCLVGNSLGCYSREWVRYPEIGKALMWSEMPERHGQINNYFNAWKFCRYSGGWPLTIKNKRTEELAVQLTERPAWRSVAWIGLHYVWREGKLKWADGTESKEGDYRNWDRPDRLLPGYNCSQLVMPQDSNAYWRLSLCIIATTWNLGVFCETDLSNCEKRPDFKFTTEEGKWLRDEVVIVTKEQDVTFHCEGLVKPRVSKVTMGCQWVFFPGNSTSRSPWIISKTVRVGPEAQDKLCLCKVTYFDGINAEAWIRIDFQGDPKAGAKGQPHSSPAYGIFALIGAALLTMYLVLIVMARSKARERQIKMAENESSPTNDERSNKGNNDEREGNGENGSVEEEEYICQYPRSSTAGRSSNNETG